jgi:hypothetical protein
MALSQSGAGARAAEDFRKGCEFGDRGACDLLEDLKRQKSTEQLQ